MLDLTARPGREADHLNECSKPSNEKNEHADQNERDNHDQNFRSNHECGERACVLVVVHGGMSVARIDCHDFGLRLDFLMRVNSPKAQTVDMCFASRSLGSIPQLKLATGQASWSKFVRQQSLSASSHRRASVDHFRNLQRSPELSAVVAAEALTRLCLARGAQGLGVLAS